MNSHLHDSGNGQGSASEEEVVREEVVRSLGGIICACSPEKNGHMSISLGPAGSCPNCGATGPLWLQATRSKIAANGTYRYNLPEITTAYEDLPIPYHPTDKPVNPLLTKQGFVNWEAAFSAAPVRVPWIVEPFLEEAMTHALWGIPGSGKSVFALETIVSQVIGKFPVLYVDSENNLLQIIIPRLKSFGMTPELLKNLPFLSFAEMEPLDTQAGGLQLLNYAQEAGAQLVVIDTTSRFLDGDENTADTFLRFYNNTLMLLKRENIASLRLDHPGKDLSKGTRGSSAKFGDIDYEWSIADDMMNRILVCTKSRTGNVEKGTTIVLRKHGVTEDNEHFWHEWDYKPAEDKQLAEDVRTLDSLGLPLTAGNRIARDKLTQARIQMGNPRLRAAIKYRQAGNVATDVATEEN